MDIYNIQAVCILEGAWSGSVQLLSLLAGHGVSSSRSAFPRFSRRFVPEPNGPLLFFFTCRSIHSAGYINHTCRARPFYYINSVLSLYYNTPGADWSRHFIGIANIDRKGILYSFKVSLHSIQSLMTSSIYRYRNFKVVIVFRFTCMYYY